ncbi:MAG: hypothetical protein ACNS63_09775 [Candidatus Nitrospinota bacterium M3_3B_026]
MNFLDEKAFLETLRSAGIVPCREGRALCYEDEESVLGFDFTNLSIPDTSVSPFEAQGAGERSVEYAMIGTMLRILDELDLFPLYLYAVDEEWAGEDIGRLRKKGLLTVEEASVLGRVMEEGRGMDVIVVEREEAADAARLIAPQITALGTVCAATDARGRVLALFSQDDEVSFNTMDRRIYEKAAKMLETLKNLPFEVITGP